MGPTFCEMRTIVICLDATSWVIGVDVECVQMGAYLFYWLEVLNHCCAGLEHSAFDGARLAWDAVELRP